MATRSDPHHYPNHIDVKDADHYKDLGSRVPDDFCHKFDVKNHLPIFPQQQNALGSSAIVKVSEQTGAAPKPIPPRFPGFK